MKRKFVWRYLIQYPNQISSWWGTCAAWAAQPLPAEATLTRERVLVVGGKSVKCNFCSGSHIDTGAQS